MHKVVFLLVVLVGTYVFPQASNVLKHQRLDFEQFENALNNLQAKPTLHINKEQLTSYLKAAKDTLRNPLSPIEQFRVYSKLLAKLQDGHTTLQPSKAALKEWAREKQCLPFDVVFVNKKLFISPMHPKDAEEIAILEKNANKGTKGSKKPVKANKKVPTPGMEIYKIDSLTVEQWMKHIAPYLSSDENGIDFKYFQAGLFFDFYRYIALPSSSDSVKITFIAKRDTITTTIKHGYPLRHTLNTRLSNSKPATIEEKYGHFSIEKNKYGYFRFTNFVYAKGDEYNEFLKKSFESIQKKKIKYLIVDLRGNTGGAMQLEFLKYILDEGTDLGQYDIVKQVKRKQLRKMGVLMRQAPTKRYLQNKRLMRMGSLLKNEFTGELKIEKAYTSNRFKGKIVVITDEGSFSAAAILAAHLKTLADAKIVGQKAGGSFYGGNAGTLPVKLKKSKLVVNFNPNFFASNLFGEEIDADIKTPDSEAFDEDAIPQSTYEKNQKKGKVTEDQLLKFAEKLLKGKREED
jgi:hypothetical protein